jgi:predicted  nucleic acid-binding Zn-ribbon protein
MPTKIEQLEIDIANLQEAEKTLRMEIRDVKWRIKELKARKCENTPRGRA